jgi:hypothetical protein
LKGYVATYFHAIERDRHSPAEVIQAACNVNTAAIDETADKQLAIQATRRWIESSLERAKAGNNPTHHSTSHVSLKFAA